MVTLTFWIDKLSVCKQHYNEVFTNLFLLTKSRLESLRECTLSHSQFTGKSIQVYLQLAYDSAKMYIFIKCT